jgi:hypothetical protein
VVEVAQAHMVAGEAAVLTAVVARTAAVAAITDLSHEVAITNKWASLSAGPRSSFAVTQRSQ